MKVRTLLLAMMFIVPGVVQAGTIYVNGNCGNDDWSGLSPVCEPPDGPKATIQAAIDAARKKKDIVQVADGVYTGDGNRDIDFGGRLITVRSENGPDNCIIDCQGSANDPHRGFYFHKSETQDAKLDGFTIKNGYATDASPGGFFGGGVYIKKASPTVTNCTFSNNSAVREGGGMYILRGANPIVRDCTFDGNSAQYGGGILCDDSDPTIANCTITGNTADQGGGVYFYLGTGPTITTCTEGKKDKKKVDMGYHYQR